MEGQAGNIGATAFAVSNIETQKQIVCSIFRLRILDLVKSFHLVYWIKRCEETISERLQRLEA